MSGGPVPAMGVLTFHAAHVFARDLPEDFVDRVESGMDAETLSMLQRGIRAARMMTRLNRWTYALLFAGAIVFFAGATVLWGRFEAGWWILGMAVLSWLAAVGSLVASYAVYLWHRRDVHRLAAFVQAARGSSLGRDLA